MNELDTATAAQVEALAAVCKARGLMLATAESCTGGLIAAACTSLAGSSDWFERGCKGDLIRLGEEAFTTLEQGFGPVKRGKR